MHILLKYILIAVISAIFFETAELIYGDEFLIRRGIGKGVMFAILVFGFNYNKRNGNLKNGR